MVLIILRQNKKIKKYINFIIFLHYLSLSYIPWNFLKLYQDVNFVNLYFKNIILLLLLLLLLFLFTLQFKFKKTLYPLARETIITIIKEYKYNLRKSHKRYSNLFIFISIITLLVPSWVKKISIFDQIILNQYLKKIFLWFN